MKKNLFSAIFLLFFLAPLLNADLVIEQVDGHFVPKIYCDDVSLLIPPSEGLWSISTTWTNDWHGDWINANANERVQSGDWTVLLGIMEIPEGTWTFRDAYHPEGDKIRCVRRWEWQGKEILKNVTLSIRWQTSSYTDRIFMPGVLYYGNPSGYKHGRRMPTFDKKNAPEALFEEHHFPMPFVSAEVQQDSRFYGIALHSLPCLVPYGNIPDQWWSLGCVANENNTEITLLSGPIAWNNQRSSAKALQGHGLKYGDTYLNVEPGAIIEKTFFLQSYSTETKGSGFMHAVDTSLDIFKPYYAEDLPTFEQILQQKYTFACSRYIEDGDIAGFGMYPQEYGIHFVFGWCGQTAAPGYALQVLRPYLNDPDTVQKVQKSLDFLSSTPFNQNGFLLNYDKQKGTWNGQDPLSQAQAMNNYAKAIQVARKSGSYNTQKWEDFFKKACTLHANRILADNWNPISTNEAFFASPLCIAFELYQNPLYNKAVKKIVDHYAKRHLSMDEPYWGGTLDATGEDKEGAWAAFQAFFAVYEMTKEEQYLHYAKHAAYVTLSYTVVWDIPMPASRIGNHGFKSRGWTAVSPQNMHLDVYGVLYSPQIYKLGT